MHQTSIPKRRYCKNQAKLFSENVHDAFCFGYKDLVLNVDSQRTLHVIIAFMLLLLAHLVC